MHRCCFIHTRSCVSSHADRRCSHVIMSSTSRSNLPRGHMAWSRATAPDASNLWALSRRTAATASSDVPRSPWEFPRRNSQSVQIPAHRGPKPLVMYAHLVVASAQARPLWCRHRRHMVQCAGLWFRRHRHWINMPANHSVWPTRTKLSHPGGVGAAHVRTFGVLVLRLVHQGHSEAHPACPSPRRS